MGVWLDPRAGSGDLLRWFPRGYAQLMELNASDVMGCGYGPDGEILWGVEIKKIGDALQSMQSGRLTEQLGKMHEDFDWKFLLIEGETRCHWETGNLQCRVKGKSGKGEWWADALFGNKQKISYVHFMSWLFSLALCSGTQLITSAGRGETAATIVALDRMLSKPWTSHSSLKVFNESQPGMFIPSVAMTVAKDLSRGVGWEKAALAADHFKTVRAMVNADVEEWLEVDGFDKVLAARMVEGATVPHVLRQRRGKAKGASSGQSHVDVSAPSGDSKAKKRRSDTGKVHHTTTKQKVGRG